MSETYCPNCNARVDLDAEDVARIVSENREAAARVLGGEKPQLPKFDFTVHEEQHDGKTVIVVGPAGKAKG